MIILDKYNYECCENIKEGKERLNEMMKRATQTPGGKHSEQREQAASTRVCLAQLRYTRPV